MSSETTLLFRDPFTTSSFTLPLPRQLDTMSMITSYIPLVSHASSECTCTACKCSNCTCGTPVLQASGGCGSTTCTCEFCACKAGECKC
ncbi:hypothetical protein B0H34DRAFT_861698 [Crassisporium funariophilum]|nr:hypothetical protein B0H34DRAFT_861698 [Crassisporium funariophilum]